MENPFKKLFKQPTYSSTEEELRKSFRAEVDKNNLMIKKFGERELTPETKRVEIEVMEELINEIKHFPGDPNVIDQVLEKELNDSARNHETDWDKSRGDLLRQHAFTIYNGGTLGFYSNPKLLSRIKAIKKKLIALETRDHAEALRMDAAYEQARRDMEGAFQELFVYAAMHEKISDMPGFAVLSEKFEKADKEFKTIQQKLDAKIPDYPE